MAAVASLRIAPVDHTGVEIARRLHAIQMEAYEQEARLVGATWFPPLDRTLDDLRASAECFLAAFVEGEIVGALGMAPDDEGLGTNIASLVVAPAHQRRGIGRLLMDAVLAEHAGGGLTVQTAARNLPALELYRQLGFVELRRWCVGPDSLELVKLLRPATP